MIESPAYPREEERNGCLVFRIVGGKITDLDERVEDIDTANESCS